MTQHEATQPITPVAERLTSRENANPRAESASMLFRSAIMAQAGEAARVKTPEEIRQLKGKEGVMAQLGYLLRDHPQTNELVYEHNSKEDMPIVVAWNSKDSAVALADVDTKDPSLEIAHIVKIWPGTGDKFRVLLGPVAGQGTSASGSIIEVSRGFMADAMMRAHREFFAVIEPRTDGAPPVKNYKVPSDSGDSEFMSAYMRFLASGEEQHMKDAANHFDAQKNALENKGLILTKETLKRSLKAWREKTIRAHMPTETAIQNTAQTRLAQEPDPKPKLADVVETVKKESYAEALTKLTPAEDVLVKKAEDLEKEIDSSKSEMPTSEQLYTFYTITLAADLDPAQKINRNNLRRNTLMQELGPGASAGLRSKNEQEIAVLEAENKILEAPEFTRADGTVISLDKTIRAMCDRVATGDTAGDPVSRMFADFIKDPQKNESMLKSIEGARQQQMAEYIDSLKLGQKGEDMKKLLEEWGPKIGYVILILLQQMLTEAARNS